MKGFDESPVALLVAGPVAIIVGYLLLRYWNRIDKFSLKYLVFDDSRRNYSPLMLWLLGGMSIMFGVAMIYFGLKLIFDG